MKINIKNFESNGHSLQNKTMIELVISLKATCLLAHVNTTFKDQSQPLRKTMIEATS